MEITKIIKEEFQKILNEGYVFENDNLNFRQVIQNSSFYNYQNFSNDYDVDISESNIIVDWRIGFWLNDSGVENFIIQADRVEGTYKVVLLDKQSDEVAQENDKNIAEIPWKFEINDVVLQKGGSLYISNLEFNFADKICSVTFNNFDNSMSESKIPAQFLSKIDN